LKREFKEETSLEVKIGNILGIRIEKSFDRIKLIIIFEAILFQGEVKLNNENTEYNWFPKFPSHSVFDYSRYLETEKQWLSKLGCFQARFSW